MRILRSVAAALIGLCSALSEARAQSFDTGAPIAIGSIQMGLTLEEVRAALPAVEWQQDAERNPLGRRTMRASRALELFGVLYDLEVEQGEGTDRLSGNDRWRDGRFDQLLQIRRGVRA